MKDFFHSLKFKIILCILALVLGLMLYVATTSGSGSAVSSALGAFFEPVQKLSASISNKVSSTIDMLINAGDYYNENTRLKEELGALREELVEQDTIKDENIHLREMLGLKEDYPDLEFSPPCSIIGRSANDIYMSFTIDKGEKDGVTLHDPVVTKDGLVGFVSEVQLTYSTVTTVLSQDISLGVYCSRTRDTGITQGSYQQALDSTFMMKFISIDSTIAEGDIIVTSGHSGLVPKERIIGFVESVEIDSSGLSKNAVIKPAVDIASVKNVFVITSFEGQGNGYGN